MDRGLILMPKISTTKICVSVGGKRVKLKYWNTPEEAFAEYKTIKEKIIKEYAERYRGQIDEKVYNAMMEWQIEITD